MTSKSQQHPAATDSGLSIMVCHLAIDLGEKITVVIGNFHHIISICLARSPGSSIATEWCRLQPAAVHKEMCMCHIEIHAHKHSTDICNSASDRFVFLTDPQQQIISRVTHKAPQGPLSKSHPPYRRHKNNLGIKSICKKRILQTRGLGKKINGDQWQSSVDTLFPQYLKKTFGRRCSLS